MSRRLLLLSVCIFSVCTSQPLYGQSSPRVAALRAEYVRLRNNDPQGNGAPFASAWITLSKQMHAVLNGTKGREDVDRLRLYTADVDLRLYHSHGDRSYLTLARSALEPLVRSSSTDFDRGDALLMMGDIELASSGDSDEAQSFYEEALGFPEPLRLRAQQRLQGVHNKTFDVGLSSIDVEVPRLVRTGSLNKRVTIGPVVIDPGHGGYDTGAVGYGRLEEKEITLDIAKRVRTILWDRYSIPVLLTRDGDNFTPLARRTAYANSKSASAFVSLHVNASAAHDGSGLEAYYLDNTNDAASQKLAERENGVASGGGVDDISFMVSDLIQSGKLEDSIRLTRSIESGVRGRVEPSYSEVRFLGVKKAPFFVLVGAHMPCSLIEMFFVDHPVDGARLSDESFRQSVAIGVAEGIVRFVRGEPIPTAASSVRVAASRPAHPSRKVKRGKKQA